MWLRIPIGFGLIAIHESERLLHDSEVISWFKNRITVNVKYKKLHITIEYLVDCQSQAAEFVPTDCP